MRGWRKLKVCQYFPCIAALAPPHCRISAVGRRIDTLYGDLRGWLLASRRASFIWPPPRLRRAALATQLECFHLCKLYVRGMLLRDCVLDVIGCLQTVDQMVFQLSCGGQWGIAYQRPQFFTPEMLHVNVSVSEGRRKRISAQCLKQEQMFANLKLPYMRVGLK